MTPNAFFSQGKDAFQRIVFFNVLRPEASAQLEEETICQAAVQTSVELCAMVFAERTQSGHPFPIPKMTEHDENKRMGLQFLVNFFNAHKTHVTLELLATHGAEFQGFHEIVAQEMIELALNLP